jgi:hypothetical protein
MARLPARPRIRGVEDENSNGARPMGVRRSTSIKCEDTNIYFGSRQAPVHLINALIFYFEALLYVLLDCALSPEIG